MAARTASGSTANGASSTSRTASRARGTSPRPAAPTRPGSRSGAAAPGATPPWPRSPSMTCSGPGRATTGSATSRCSRPTPTSSRPATSIGWSASGPPSATSTARARPCTTPRGSRARSSSSRGLDDRVVPPNQAELMANELDRQGLPVACLMFEGEGHGFRKADTVRRCLEAELAFYGRVFGFEPADPLPPLDIREPQGSSGRVSPPAPDKNRGSAAPDRAGLTLENHRFPPRPWNPAASWRPSPRNPQNSSGKRREASVKKSSPRYPRA